MNQARKVQLQKDQEAIQELFDKLQPLVNKYGVDYHGTEIHEHLQQGLNLLRNKSKAITDELDGNRCAECDASLFGQCDRHRPSEN